MLILRSAYRLANSFNLRGRLKQLFHVLTDDKIGSGPRPAPHSLQNVQKGPAPQAIAPGTSQGSDAGQESVMAVDPSNTEVDRPHLKRKADETAATRGKSKR